MDTPPYAAAGDAPSIDAIAPAPPDVPQPDAPRSRLRVAIAAALVGVIAGGAVAAALVAIRLRGAGEQLAGDVPADAQIYATAYLDPSAGQKLNLMNLVHRFPALAGVSDVYRWLDGLAAGQERSSGLSLAKDVEPWLGTQVGVVAQVDSADVPPLVIMAESRDDAAAQRALDNLRHAGAFGGWSWSAASHSGVTVTTGADPGGSAPFVYALVNHTVLIGTGAQIVDHVIDTAQGRVPNLTTSAQFTRTFASLPRDRLGLVYVDMHSLGASLSKLMGGVLPFAGSAATNPSAAFDALQGLGITLSAQSGGFAVDTAMGIDPSRLPAGSTTAATSGGVDGVVREVPAGADAFYAFEGLGTMLKSALTSVASLGTDAQGFVDSLGLDTLISHLTGPAAVEVAPDASGSVGGAAMIGTDDPAGMVRFLEGFAGFFADGSGSAPSALTTETYHGTTITTAGPRAGTGVSPAFAVSGQTAIIGSNTAEVEQVVDAAHGSASVTTTPLYQQALGSGAAGGDGLLFVDIPATVRAIRGTLTGSDLSDFDARVAPNLQPLRALTATAHSLSDLQTAHIFLLVGQ